jgi:hypothetical protein
MNIFNPHPDEVNEANELLRQMLVDVAGPTDLARQSDEQLEALLGSVSDVTLDDEQVDVILRKVEAKLITVEHSPIQASAPPVPTLPN